MNRSNKSHILLANFKKLNKISYPLAVIGIFAIIISHFLFQFFFIQNENIQVAEELVKTEQFDVNEQTELKVKLPEVIEAKSELTEEKSLVETKTQAKKEEFIKVSERNPVKPPRFHTRAKNKSKRTKIKRKVPRKETTAERLRRAERILTGAE